MVRAKWTIDEAQTPRQAAQLLRARAEALEALARRAGTSSGRSRTATDIWPTTRTSRFDPDEI